MYAYIKGAIEDIGEGHLVVENNNIGYSIYVSNNCLNKLGVKGNSITIHTFLNVREDEMSLYGFYSIEEKAMFLKLINISGVGPKLALSVLSGLDVANLANVIMAGDIKTLVTIKGLGKKTAERIILELRGSVEDLSSVEVVSTPQENSNINDAILALINLGISRQEAYNSVMKASQNTEDTGELVSTALRSLYK